MEAVLVPQYRFRGTNASLLCKYELESNEELFSLKWYKEDTEFYRHTPQDPLSQPPPMNTYNGRQKPSQFEMNSRRRKPVSAYRPHNSGLIQTWPVSGIKIDVSFLIPCYS